MHRLCSGSCSGPRACLKTTRSPAARDFGRRQGGEDRASPQRAVCEGRCVKHGLFLSVCQEYILDTTTPDTHFHQCLQAFRVLKIYVTVTCTLSASCATMQKQSQNYEGRTKKAECYRLKAELRIMNSICENLCRSAAMIWTTERFGPGLISLELSARIQGVSGRFNSNQKKEKKNPEISNFKF